jgi:FkbM family methyltransferase
MKIFEVGVGAPDVCRAVQCGANPADIYLFEPNITTFHALCVAFGQSGINLFNVAVGDHAKLVPLHQKGGSSFVAGVRAPEVCCAPAMANTLPTQMVAMVRMKDIDPGDVDVLFLDTEGCEWLVLKDMISRPAEIVIEMHSFGSDYDNPHYDEIMTWCAQNGYTLSGKNPLGEDYIFKKL